jgi:hypothetical protein
MANDLDKRCIRSAAEQQRTCLYHSGVNHGHGQILFATIVSTIAKIPEDGLGHGISGWPFRPDQRGFFHTNREFASLKTFPLDCKFEKQNTNA